MLSLQAVKKQLRNGKYAWPGAYPIFAITADCEVLSLEAIRDNWREVVTAHMITKDKQWMIAAFDVNWENPELYCAHTNERIESAYAED